MKKYIILFIYVITFCSCSEQLETRLSTSVDANNLITDIESLNIAVNGLYDNLQPEEYYNRTVMLVPELLSDNAMIDNFDNAGRYVNYDDFVFNANDADATDLWNNIYTSISSASIIIRQSSTVEFPESQKEDVSHRIGEAYTIRALGYLNLQLFYAQPYNTTPDASHLGVPIVDENLTGGVEFLSPPRSSTAEVYAQIISDLETAIELLGKGSSPFKINEYGAKALLARVYMHMENWTMAEKFALDVIENGGYNLISNDEYLNVWEQDSNPESIFSLSNTITDNEGTNSIGYFYLGYIDAFATENFVALFSDTDIRKQLYPYDDDFEANLITKYPKLTTRDDNLPIIRLSEMYLIQAEAYAQTGETTKAQIALDAIISRADPSASPSIETGQELIEKIIIERRKELAFEGFRLFDLTRNKMPYTKYRQSDAEIFIDYPNNMTILPIPQDEINRNPNLDESQQNPGY